MYAIHQKYGKKPPKAGNLIKKDLFFNGFFCQFPLVERTGKKARNGKMNGQFAR
jgi:hypothetical protein